MPHRSLLLTSLRTETKQIAVGPMLEIFVYPAGTPGSPFVPPNDLPGNRDNVTLPKQIICFCSPPPEKT